MPEKLEALGIFLILMPGFTCAYLTQSLAVRRKQSDLEKAVEALLFSLILYLSILPFFGYVLPISWHPGADGSYHIAINYRFLLTLFLSSLILGILYAANVNHDWMLGLLRKTRITERTARSTIWNDTFQEVGGFVQIGMSGGQSVLGWVRYYSDEVDDGSVFLEDAAWIDDKGDEQPIDGPGILLTREAKIESVMFLRWRTSDSQAPSYPRTS
ncbi:MAG: DUF6338 family protein [Acidobacteriaceae bacterium]